MFHMHDYEEVSRTYSPGAPRGSEMRGGSDFAMRAMLFGQTVVESKCKKCGKIKLASVAGKALKIDQRSEQTR